MANWLQKVTTSAKQNLPSLAVSTQQRPAAPAKRLPNASIVYGLAAAGFGVLGIYFLFTGAWFTGGMVVFLAACFLGMAVHFIKYG